MTRPTYFHVPPLSVVMFSGLSEVVAQLAGDPPLIECGTRLKDTIEHLQTEARAKGVAPDGIRAVETFWKAGVRVDWDVEQLHRKFGKGRG